MLKIEESVRIACPADLVRAQFADLDHHEHHCPHRRASFRVLDDSTEACHYELIARIGVLKLRQEFVLDRTSDDDLVNTVIKGPLRGGTITFRVRGEGVGSVVTAIVQGQPRRLERLAGPVLRRVLQRNLARGLDEDRVDIESGHYSRPAPTK